jgi:hypothetical protein
LIQKSKKGNLGGILQDFRSTQVVIWSLATLDYE